MRNAKRNKEMKSLDLFKKGFRKNEIVIYAIALMLVTAGYFNYTANIDGDSVETTVQEFTNTEQNDIAETQSKNQTDENIGDAKLVNSNSVVKEEENKKNDDKDIKYNKDNTNEKEVEDMSDYFTATKLERDTNYADMISTYTKILEDNSVSETQKSIAMKEITKINKTKNAISICENLLSGKGFTNHVVLVNSDSVNVVVKVEGGLKKDKVAQIQNIIARELNSKIEDIHITEK